MKIFIITFLVVISEIPCIVRTIAIKSSDSFVWDVVVGTTLGNFLALGIGLLLAKYFGNLPEDALKDYSAMALICIGMLLLVRGI